MKRQECITWHLLRKAIMHMNLYYLIMVRGSSYSVLYFTSPYVSGYQYNQPISFLFSFPQPSALNRFGAGPTQIRGSKKCFDKFRKGLGGSTRKL